ncbi:MAG TPA: hypothetical protein VLK83_12925 [Rhodanobacteraceae bacterium]|nr:hypothetical protein [Rhodanobacteraceae bacterium]
MIELRAQMFELIRIELAARGELALFDVVVVVLLGSEGELVPDRTRVGPQPGDRPEQSAEHEREQAQDVNRILVGMVALCGDLLGQHVHDPEERDEGDRHHDEHEPGEPVGHRVQRFAMQERCVGGWREEHCQQGCADANASRQIRQLVIEHPDLPVKCHR